MEKISFQIYEERRKLCMAESVRRDRDDDFRYEIVRHFGILSTSVKGWTKEFNSVSWNGAPRSMTSETGAPSISTCPAASP